MNQTQFSRRIVEVKQIPRGRGHVRLVVLECGHTRETMASINQLWERMNCEDCRKVK